MTADSSLGEKLQEFGAIVLCANGLSITKLQQTILWGDVTAVDGHIVVRYHGSPVVIGVDSFTLTLKGGEKIKLPMDGSMEFTPLVSRVHDEVNARFLPRAREALKTGKTLPFGPIELSAEGLMVEDRLLPWNDFAGMTFDPDHLYLWASDEKTPSHKVRLKTVRRPGLLMALAEQLTGASTDTFHTEAEGQTAPAPRRPSKSGAARQPAKIPDSEHAATLLGRIKVGGTGFMLSLAAVALGIGFLVLAFSGAAVGSRTPLFILAAFLIACGPLGIVYLFWKMRGIASQAAVGPKGLTWRSGGEEQERPWRDVREVWNKNEYRLQGGEKPNDYNRKTLLRVVFTDGVEANFNHALTDYDQFVAVVQQAVANALLPKYQADVSRDGAVFGPLTLTEKGLRREDGKLLAWEKIAKAGVGNGALWWESAKGKMNSVSLADVPNSLLLVSLVGAFVGNRWKG